MTRRQLLGLALAAATVLGCAALPAATSSADARAADAVPAPLRILLTNDDGVDAPGLAAVRAALVAAGHEVVVVAPAGNRSGSSVSITTEGTLAAEEREPGVWSVSGTPADCVRVALGAVLDSPPDLVVSGANFGQNVGGGTTSSGTVGAAITALRLGVPALAVSQAVDFRDPRATLQFFPDAAAFTARLVGALAARRGEGPVLPLGLILNANHPTRHADAVAGVRLTRQGATAGFDLAYERNDAGFEIGFRPDVREETVPNADISALNEGFVTITPLDGDWTATPSTGADLAALVDALN